MYGLFGYNQGTLKNIKLDNFNITGNDFVGGLVSYNIGNVQGCEISQNSVITGNSYVGGLIGYTIGVVTGSTSNAVVNGTSNVGGLIGYVYAINSNLTIESLGATGKVTGGANVGGLVGNSNIDHTGGVENVTYSIYIKKSYASRRSSWSNKCRRISRNTTK